MNGNYDLIHLERQNHDAEFWIQPLILRCWIVASWIENCPTQLLCLLPYQQNTEKEIGINLPENAERFIFLNLEIAEPMKE